MQGQYTIEITFNQAQIQVSLDRDTTIKELYNYLKDECPDKFRNEKNQNLKFFVPSKNQFLENNSTTLETILGSNVFCKFELKEDINQLGSNDFAVSNQIHPIQTQQQQLGNNFQTQNVYNQGQYLNSIQTQQVQQHQQNFQQPAIQNHYQQNQIVLQTNQSPNQQNQYQNQYGQNQNNFQQQYQQQQQGSPLKYQQNQMNNQHNNQQNKLTITLKYEQNKIELEVDADLTLDELSAHIYSSFEIDGQIEMFFGNLHLSKLNLNTSIYQAGIRNNSIIECRQQSNQLQQNPVPIVNNINRGQPEQNLQHHSQFNLFYQQMRFEEVFQQSPQQSPQQVPQQAPYQATQQVPQPVPYKDPQQVSSQANKQMNQIKNQFQNLQIQQPQSPNGSNDIQIKVQIIDGTINHSFQMRATIYQTLNEIIEAILQYLGYTGKIAAIQLFKDKIQIQGDKLQFTLQKLQMVQNPLELNAKVMYTGGSINGILC